MSLPHLTLSRRAALLLPPAARRRRVAGADRLERDVPLPGQRLQEHDRARKEARKARLQAASTARRVTVDPDDASRARRRGAPRGAGGGDRASTRWRSARATAMRAASSKASCAAEEEKLAVLQKEFNNGEPERQGDERNYQKYLDRVGDMSAAIARKRERHRRAPARDREAAAAAAAVIAPAVAAGADQPGGRAGRASTCWRRWSPSSAPEGECVFVNAAFENVLGLSRRSMRAASVFDWFVEPQVLRDTVAARQQQRLLDQPARGLPEAPRPREPLPVHVTVNADRRRAATSSSRSSRSSSRTARTARSARSTRPRPTRS